MAQSVLADAGDLVSFDVVIDGISVPELIVIHIDVDLRVDHLPRAAITLDDGDPAASDFAESGSDRMLPGKTVEIRLGYHSKNKSVFKGVILGHRLRVTRAGHSELTLICGDRAEALTLSRHSAQFLDASDADVIAKLARAGGVKADVDGATRQRPQQVQNAASDWDFILSRAEANGMVVIVADGVLTVAEPGKGRAAMSVEFGDTISHMDLAIDASRQVGKVTSRVWNPAQQELVEVTSVEPSVPGQGDPDGAALARVLGDVTTSLQSQSDLPRDDLQSWADGRLRRTRLARIRGTVRFAGTAGIELGGVLDLKGVGKRLTGAGYVAGLRHVLANGDWTTEATLGLDPEGVGDRSRGVSAPGAAALRPAVSGLQIAKVLQTDADPDGQRRIRVAMPLQTDGGDGLWVRLATPYATDKAGMVFLPEVGDEVVLGFLDSDPDSGIVLGALQSGARPAPLVPDEENTIKAIVTRSQLKLAMDDAKQIISIETPGGQVVTLSDEDKTITLTDTTGNEVKLSENGVEVSSPKDISLAAKGSLSLSGDAGVTVDSSGGDVAISGQNASLKGLTSAKVDGGASAALTGGTEAKVAAAMVMIN